MADGINWVNNASVKLLTAHVLLFVTVIATVIVTVTFVHEWDAALVVAGEVVCFAWRVNCDGQGKAG